MPTQKGQSKDMNGHDTFFVKYQAEVRIYYRRLVILLTYKILKDKKIFLIS